MSIEVSGMTHVITSIDELIAEYKRLKSMYEEYAADNYRLEQEIKRLESEKKVSPDVQIVFGVSDERIGSGWSDGNCFDDFYKANERYNDIIEHYTLNQDVNYYHFIKLSVLIFDTDDLLIDEKIIKAFTI